MLVTAEEFQVVTDRLLDFRVAGQGATVSQAQALSGLGLGEAKILDALLDDDASSLLGKHLARTIVADGRSPAHFLAPSLKTGSSYRQTC